MWITAIHISNLGDEANSFYSDIHQPNCVNAVAAPWNLPSVNTSPYHTSLVSWIILTDFTKKKKKKKHDLGGGGGGGGGLRKFFLALFVN